MTNRLYKTFVHRFKNGKQCTLVMDFRDFPPRVASRWADSEGNRAEIEDEYVTWLETCFELFMEDLELDEVLLVVAGAAHFTEKEVA